MPSRRSCKFGPTYALSPPVCFPSNPLTICRSQFLTFAQIDKRPDVEQKPLADEDADFDSDSDGMCV